MTSLLSCVKSLKHRTLLLTLYAAGLRISEGAALTIADIDSSRMQLRIARGKGAKERLVPMSPRLLLALRYYEGLGVRELSCALGLSSQEVCQEISKAVSQVYRTLIRAEEKLRKEARA